MLILDDLQWADTSTALLLGHLLQDAEPMRLLVLGTIRAPDEHRADELADAARAACTATRASSAIALTGLDDAETQALVARARPATSASSFVRRLHEGTDGNPFFIKETLRSLPTSPS